MLFFVLLLLLLLLLLLTAIELSLRGSIPTLVRTKIKIHETTITTKQLLYLCVQELRFGTALFARGLKVVFCFLIHISFTEFNSGISKNRRV